MNWKRKITEEQLEDAARLRTIWDSTAGREYRREHQASTQEAFGQIYGIGNQAAVGSFLNGKTALSLKAAIGFAHGLGVRVEDFSPCLAKLAPVSPNSAELHLLQVLARYGILDATLVDQRRPPADLPGWMETHGKSFFPDIRVVAQSGRVGWVEVKSQLLEPTLHNDLLNLWQQEHPELLVIEPSEVASQKVVDWIALLNRGSSTSTTRADHLGRMPMRNPRPVWVVGKTQGSMPSRIWDDGDQPAGATGDHAEVFTTDERAFACCVVGDSMVPRYMPGEFALIEPGIATELEDDVLVRLATGETMLKRLLGRRMGIRLGSYNSPEVLTFREEDITWMYHVAHPIPARRIRQRVAVETYHGPERRLTDEPAPANRRSLGRLITSDSPDHHPGPAPGRKVMNR